MTNETINDNTVKYDILIVQLQNVSLFRLRVYYFVGSRVLKCFEILYILP